MVKYRRKIIITLILVLFVLLAILVTYRIWNKVLYYNYNSGLLWVGSRYNPSNKIAYVVDVNSQRSDIFVSRLDGNIKENITSNIFPQDDSISFRDPVLSPSKNKLAFVAIETITTYLNDGQDLITAIIYIYLKDNQNMMPVKIYEYTQNKNYFSPIKPIWSKDESFLIVFDGSYKEGGRYIRVSLIPPYSSEISNFSDDKKRLADWNNKMKTETSGDSYPEFSPVSPNGKYRLIFSYRRCGFLFCEGVGKVELESLIIFGIGSRIRISNASGARPLWFANSDYFVFQDFVFPDREMISTYNIRGQLIHQINGRNFDL